MIREKKYAIFHFLTLAEPEIILLVAIYGVALLFPEITFKSKRF
jgi:hypothetical protein